MRNYLTYCRKWLKLDPKTEIFPKQDRVSVSQDKNGNKKYGYGNGITIPYRAFHIHNNKDQPWGVEVYNETKLRLIQPLFFFQMLEERTKQRTLSKILRYLNGRYTRRSRGGSKVYQEGSMQDPEIQRLTGKEILAKIKEKRCL